ncbi:MAG: serine protease [Pyrinomonadaceae bacterium]
MKRKVCRLALILATLSLSAPALASGDSTNIVRQRESYTVSVDLKFSKKDANSLQHVFSFLDFGPNGFATGFIVGDGLVMTAYHVVSGQLSAGKKVQLGFAPKDELEVKAYVNGCQATVLRVDAAADLALLRVCHAPKQASAPAFQPSPGKEERLLLIARPNGDRAVKRGVFDGPYMMRGLQYWSAKIDGRDGYSGSPIYNERAELIGVFSSYDGSRKLAVISPGARAQKLLEEYVATASVSAASASAAGN